MARARQNDIWMNMWWFCTWNTVHNLFFKWQKFCPSLVGYCNVFIGVNCRGAAMASAIQQSHAFPVATMSSRTTGPHQKIGGILVRTVITALPWDVMKSLHVSRTLTPSVLRTVNRGKRRYLPSFTGLNLGLRPANERRRYKVTPSLIGWAQT